MPTNQPPLSDQLIPHPVKKFQVSESDGTRLIRIDGQQIFCLETSDETTCRHAAVQLYLCWKVSQSEIAGAWDVTVRTVNSWVRQYRSSGISGLKTKTLGTPVKVTPAVRRKVIRMRNQNDKIPEICRRLSICKSTVYRVFEENKAAQDELIVDVESCSEVTADESEGVISVDSTCELSEVVDLTKPADPLDRSVDRFSAQLGLIDDAVPVFAESDHVELAGVFLAVAMLSKSDFFQCIKKVYITLGPAFYGLRTTFMSLFMMAVLRIKNAEQLNDRNPQKLGRLLGLDRAPAVKTLRRKINILCGRNQAINLMNLLGQKKFEEANLPDAVLYIDGHVQCYYGKGNLGKSFSTTRNRALKANTDYWINLADGTPLLCIPTDFNQRMSQMLPNIILHAKKLCKDKRITVVFDRAGSSAGVFEKLIGLGCDFIAYNKNPKAIDNSLFKKQKTTINGKEYDYAPYDRQIKMPVYQKNSKGQYRKTQRLVSVREIIILREDGGQTAIVTSRKDLDAVTVADTLFRRWSQENFFKYLVAMYDFDHVCVYRKEKVSKGGDHPNPEYVQLTKTIKTIRRRIGTILGVAFDKVSDSEFLQSIEKIGGNLSPLKSAELSQLKVNLKNARAVLKTTAKREDTDAYESLEPQSRLICNIVKMTAYHIEGKLARILENYWNGINGNERGILSGFLQSTGAIRLTGNVISITLEKQATPERTRMLKRLCDDMTVVAARYPGTQLRMIFDIAA
jgi:transposase-like protein